MKGKLLLGGLLSLFAKAALAATIVITSGTTWTVPAGVSDVKVAVIGGGGQGGGGGGGGGVGAGGGAYASSVLHLTPGTVLNIHVNGGEQRPNTWFSDPSTLLAQGGDHGVHDGFSNPPGVGGQASASVGTTKFSGGTGATCVNPCDTSGTGGGGGGAAGPFGNGANANVQNGGAADAGHGGAGGTFPAGAGSAGTEIGGIGAGGGGAGGFASGHEGGAGGAYGGGGGGGAAGGLGVIIITPLAKRVSSGVF